MSNCSVAVFIPFPAVGSAQLSHFPDHDPGDDGTTCTQILNLHPGEHRAVSGEGPGAGKNPTKTF